MLRFGCCGCMINPQTDPIGIGVVEQCAALGFDYIELSLRDVAALSEEAYKALRRRLEASGLRCEACNNFFPPEKRLTGPALDFTSVAAYTDFALTRARELGAEVVVFGSSGARNIPEGFPQDEAWNQIVRISKMIGDTAERIGITIAIEYHNKGEANVLTSMEEALVLQEEVSKSRLKLLSDYYHFGLEKEPLSVLTKAGKDIVHIHISDLEKRAFPMIAKEEYKAYFRTLAAIPYRGRVSIEALTSDFLSDGRKALAILKTLAV